MDWKVPSRDLSLGAEEVHLWRIPLDRDRRLVEERRPLLSVEETERAQRFQFDLHRERFILRRGALRIILGRYLGIVPRAIEILTSERGKPEARQEPGAPLLRFNLSDSEELALVGVTMDREIGVDIEFMRPIPEMDAIAREHFCAEELAAYLGVPPSRRMECFYNGWTRKEAWLKARGDGLWVALDSFEVTLVPGDPPRLLRVKDEPGESRRWRLHAFTPQPGYLAALAVSGAAARIEGFVT